MEKIKTFINKWGKTIAFSVWVALLLLILACCIYTAIIRPILGVPSAIASVVLLAVTSIQMYKEIKSNL